MLATLLLSQGVPMLLAGDECGRTQNGNNNAYCQDNEISWFDWTLTPPRRDLLAAAKRLIELRRKHPVLRQTRYLMGDLIWDSEFKDLAWLRPDANEMEPADWQKPTISSFGFMLGGDALHTLDAKGRRIVDDDLLVLMNAGPEEGTFVLPHESGGDWFLELDTGDPAKPAAVDGRGYHGEYRLQARSLGIFRRPLAPELKRNAAIAPARAAERANRRQRRRAGVVVPLFALRSREDWGVGGIGDIPRFAKWAAQAGFSVMQFLPVNETSDGDFSPYAAVSAFALDPVYLAPEKCEDFVAAGGREALPAEAQELLKSVGAPSSQIDWPKARKIKEAVIEVAFQRFLKEEWSKKTGRAQLLNVFIQDQRSWLDDHALFVVLHRKYRKSWLDWPRGARDRAATAMAEIRRNQAMDLLRVNWVQWQLDLQWRAARHAALTEGVDLMGDLPFMVGRDSSDVWAHRELFAVDRSVGTPPSGEIEGQDWGLPAYDWDAHKKNELAWIKARAKRAGELFGTFRVDHALGFYRTYFRVRDQPGDNRAGEGRAEARAGEGELSGFTPSEESAQLALGERVMRTLGRFGEVVAEDLGDVPGFLRPSLEKLRIPGYKVLRWEKDGDQYRNPVDWPACSVATVSTHDTDTAADWYDALSPEERDKLRALPGLQDLDPAQPFNEKVRDALLKVIYEAPSTMALTLLQDVLGTRQRINTPGKVDPANWTYRMERAVEELESDEATTQRLLELAVQFNRAPPNHKAK